MDPLAEQAPDWSPFRYGFNNHVRYTDPTGMFEVDDPPVGFPQADGATHSDDKGNWTYNKASDTWQGQGGTENLANSIQLDEVAIGGNNSQNDGGCSDCLDPSTTGKQFGGILSLSYPGGNNPLTRSGDYSYSYVPTNLSEYPAIGHDRRYDKLGIRGASGLFTDTRAIGADWRFVHEELSIAANPFLHPVDKMSAGVLGIGLGFVALPKTIMQLGKPFGLMETMMWYNISNQGVDNAPTIHKH